MLEKAVSIQVENTQGYAVAVVEKNYEVQLGVSIFQFYMNVFLLLFCSGEILLYYLCMNCGSLPNQLNCFLNKSPCLVCLQMLTSRIMIFKYVDSTQELSGHKVIQDWS